MGKLLRSVLGGAALAGLLAPAMAQQVSVTGGQVAGLAMADGSTIFYGIPYAAAPSGALRWRPPAPRAPWQGVLDGRKPAPACVQADAGWNQSFMKDAQEDCLTVSLRTPALDKQARLPVLVYVHGGSNAAGGAGSLADDAIHREGIVLVKLQYRLGAFGFLGLDALRQEDPQQSSANYGLLDQIAALHWVKANIAAFGGDPQRVTLSGNSAGATDVLFLTYSPLAKGLFQRAILQSAAPGAPRTAAQSEAMGNALLERLKLPHGAAGLAALRQLPAEAINAAALNLPTPPGVDPSFTWEQQNVDGYVLPESYASAYAKSAGRGIAMIIGSNAQELGADRKPEAGAVLVDAAFGARAPAARSLYGFRDGLAPAADPELGSIPTQVMTDMWFRCPSHWLAQRTLAVSPSVWRYEFGFGAPGSGKPPEHTSEMDYVYRAVPANLAAGDWPPVQRYWANFIRNGNPNGAGLPAWPGVAERDAVLSIAPAGIQVRHGARAAICELMFKDVDHPPSAVAPNPSASGVPAATPTAPVKVTGGTIVGVRDGAMSSYLGIPFAAPPVGALRWRSPQPVVPWQGMRQASSFSAACAQTAEWIPDPKSEDCLYLNVWAPEHAGKLPVIVWFHGGGYYGGTAAQPLYHGANLARHGAIVVTVNYRLGIFGFFAHPELAAESPDKASGNQGIEDQIAALRWVKDNIAAFGGDPGRVTIVGESAGAETVAVMVASPLAKGLFQRAIAQSGNDALPLNPEEHSLFDRKPREALGQEFARNVGAKGLADLRGMSVQALQKPAWPARVIVDGHVIREDLTTIYRKRRHNDVPLLVGWNAEEGKDLAAEIVGSSDFTAARHREQVAKLLGYAPSDAMLSAYPGATDGQAKASIHQLTNDWWGWRMVHWAELQAAYGSAKPYVYFFAHTPAAPSTPCGYGCGVGHGVEIQYVFDQLDLDKRGWTAADRRLATRLAKTWVNFAATGNPNGKGLPAWPAFDGSQASILRIGEAADLNVHRLPDFSVFPPLAK
jgi:para-nitrobenzyl esterase